jgi:membrane associated rhomboid family serine protease
MSTIIDQLKQKYKTGSVLTKLIFINIGVFLVLRVMYVILRLFFPEMISPDLMMTFLSVPSNLETAYQPNLLHRLWTLFTYMFVHWDFLHILFNLLWLYWFGRMFMQYFTGRTLGSLYVLGGLAGALLYIVAFNTIPLYVRGMEHGFMIGASASVMAIVFGVAFYRPDAKLNLLFLGQIKIVYIAIAAFVIDILFLTGDNAGGRVAHIGGAALGYLFAVQYKKGKEITAWISVLIDRFVNLFKPRPKKSKMKIEHARRETDWEYNKRKNDEQAEIDAILDKLKQSGYSNLSSEEKRKLFDASKK